MQIDFLTWVVIAANMTGAAMALPQAAKLRRHRRANGVSPGWAGMSVCVNVWWAVYGVAIGNPGIVPVSIVSVMAYSLIGLTLFQLRTGARRVVLVPMVGGMAAVGVVPLVAFASGGWTAAGLALGALYGVQLSPAVVAVYRSYDVSGVSAATWTIALAEALLWGVYGAARSDVGLLALASTGTLMSVFVLARLFSRRPRRGVVAAHPALELAVG